MKYLIISDNQLEDLKLLVHYAVCAKGSNLNLAAVEEIKNLILNAKKVNTLPEKVVVENTPTEKAAAEGTPNG